MKSILTVLCAALFFGFSATAASAQTSRKSVPAAEVNGTFRMPFTGRFKGSSNEIKILALGGGKLHIAMELMYPFVVNGELSANLGELDGEAAIVGDVAVYDSMPRTAHALSPSNSSGPARSRSRRKAWTSLADLAHNVFADGTYKKISSAKPKFDAVQ